ncbi:MAG: hypothetical protein EOP09_07155 [Proteobacteria bacterium]|nr:MAG: hypothetical protein EOP09_07155 [Pseudomonadota bacterium]
MIFRVLGLLLIAASAHAADPAPRPSGSRLYTPPTLGRPVPTNPFQCERLLRYKGKILSCDTHMSNDGEGLRPIYEGTPEALQELDVYQRNRKRVRLGGYTGTFSIVLFLANPLIANLVTKDQSKRDSLKTTLRLTGVAITLGSAVYGISYLKANEEHLNRSITRFNDRHPTDQIELIYKTEF